jgi:hypothetical protein
MNSRSALDAITMPFGKYKDKRVDNLPTEYLTWLWESVELDKWYGLEKVVHDTLERRGKL